MKILLTHGYFLEEDPKEMEIMKPYPTLGLLYISGYLNQKGVVHDVFDTTFSSTNEFKNHLLATQPEVIAFYTNLMTKVKVIELIQFIRSQEQLQKIKVVLGGPDLTYNQKKYLNAGADFLVIGEGEETFYELVEALRKEESTDQINGVSYMQEGELNVNAPRIKMKDLEDLPLPNRAAYPIKKYLDTWKRYHGRGIERECATH